MMGSKQYVRYISLLDFQVAKIHKTTGKWVSDAILAGYSFEMNRVERIILWSDGWIRTMGACNG